MAALFLAGHLENFTEAPQGGNSWYLVFLLFLGLRQHRFVQLQNTVQKQQSAGLCSTVEWPSTALLYWLVTILSFIMYYRNKGVIHHLQARHKRVYLFKWENNLPKENCSEMGGAFNTSVLFNETLGGLLLMCSTKSQWDFEHCACNVIL